MANCQQGFSRDVEREGKDVKRLLFWKAARSREGGCGQRAGRIMGYQCPPRQGRERLKTDKRNTSLKQPTATLGDCAEAEGEKGF